MSTGGAGATVIERPSPSCGRRPAKGAIDMLILHYTGMESAADALMRMCDPAARVSAHYMIDENGEIYRLVEEAMRAWHAGESWWRGATNINDRSIGIELVNPGHAFGYRRFPEPQMAALIDLCRDILSRHGIPPVNVLGHSDVAPARKLDPGELFDWRRLAGSRIGLWPSEVTAGAAPADQAAALEVLGRIGYQVGGTGDQASKASVGAFQRRYRPARIDGVIDGETAALIAAVAELAA
jgi:N-acetylmuramoyl-L-alanine amidase